MVLFFGFIFLMVKLDIVLFIYIDFLVVYSYDDVFLWF